MTQHNRAQAHKRIVMTYSPGPIVITSDKKLMTTLRTPVGSLGTAVKWKRECRRDRHSRSLSQSAQLRLRRTADGAEYAAEFAPAVGVKTPTQGPHFPGTYDTGRRPVEQWAWWEKIPARTAALAYIVAVLAAVVSGGTLIARGVAR